MLGGLRKTIIGLPLPSARMVHERLNKVQALAVLSSDALSSVAYATEEILLILVLAGSGALGLSWPIATAIGVLLLIVATSYYQTVHAYPTGGGAYTVSKENLGTLPSLVAGAALLTDYILTVAVSISAGVAAITSAFQSLEPLRVEIALVAIAIITLVNLRGLRESGRVFAIPTYFFVGSMYLLILLGLGRWLLGGLAPSPSPGPTEAAVTHNLTLFLILRAFASGCTAMTGVEAISNGVTVFKQPEADNAGQTLLWMAGILTSMFLGITFLAHQVGLTPNDNETVVSQLARHVFGLSPLYYALQAATALILLLAANTSYSDFPRLAMWMARDRFLPRQLANLGDRLVYANGITVLGVVAGVLVIIFGAQTHALIPLYAVGVFISFTLNQAGMVRHWLKLRTAGWRQLALINGTGATATAIVLVVVATTKFSGGAWVILVLIPGLVYVLQTIHRHYEEVTQQLDMSGRLPTPVSRHTIIIPVAELHRGIMKAVHYGRALGGTLHVVTVEIDPEATAQLRARWQAALPDIPLEVLPSPYRSVTEPLLAYIDQFILEEGDYVTVLVSEFVPARWWHHLLHNETAWVLKLALLYNRRNWRGRYRLISNVPFYLSK
jgi:amino acid transporter